MGSVSGKVYLNSAIGWLNRYKVQTLPGSPIQDFGGTSTIGRSLPDWKALTTLGYRNDKLGYGVRWRYQGAQDDISSVNTPNNPARGVTAYNLLDVFGNFKVSDKWELRGGVTNVLDEGLRFVASSQVSTDVAVYDAVGRSYYLGVKVSF
jgi:outer membrane receptor protein involved in Fe transport